ncbi:MAG: pyridoxal phosphate-dependent decarboxylase family protein [Actinomycetota bacterium]
MTRLDRDVIPPDRRPGRSAQDVLADLTRLKIDDVDWKNGRVFSLAYFAGDDVLDLAERAYAMYSSSNGLSTEAFPSLRQIQADVVSTVSRWVHGDSEAAGFMTSGGTESILLAVEAARQRARREKGITSPNVVLPTSAHAAFEKACSYFDVTSRRVPVGPDWRADVEAMADCVDDDTVLIVASAPQYPQGVIDPVAAIAALGHARGVNVHVDACMGGVTLSFLERSGEPIQPWDFRVEGVTSISVDLHKYGYTSKGASVLIHRSKALRAYQTFVTDNWLGGLYGSSGILGTKSGGPMAAAWAVMSYLGDDGYQSLTDRARSTCLQLADAIDLVPELELRARPDSTLLSFGGRNGLDIFAVADRLRRRGWYVDRQGPPASIHCTVHAGHESTISAFIGDLRTSVEEVLSTGDSGASGSYATIE